MERRPRGAAEVTDLDLLVKHLQAQVADLYARVRLLEAGMAAEKQKESIRQSALEFEERITRR